MAIVEMDGDSFKKIMTLKTVSIGFDRCSIFEYFKVTRCFGCGGYNHIVANCKEEKLCLNNNSVISLVKKIFLKAPHRSVFIRRKCHIYHYPQVQ
jgi:hypothetical protein